MTRFDRLSQSIEREGWATTDAVLASDVVTAIANDLASAQANAAGRGGVRNLLASHPTVRRLAAEGPLRDAAVSVMGPAAGAVRAILFDKTPDANWKVVWHQDLTIAVEGEHSVPGYGPWSRKEGVVHVQPPVEILEHMLAVRLHLDDCTSENGPVRVLPGSHRVGRLSAHDIDTWHTAVPEVICTVPRGGLLLFRPLLLHASSAARRATHRRVLHIEYGLPDLAPPIRWHTWVGAAVSEAA